MGFGFCGKRVRIRVFTQIAGYHLFEAKQKAKGQLSPGKNVFSASSKIHREVVAFFPSCWITCAHVTRTWLRPHRNSQRGAPSAARRNALNRIGHCLFNASRYFRLMSESFAGFLAQSTERAMHPKVAVMIDARSRRHRNMLRKYSYATLPLTVGLPNVCSRSFQSKY